VASALKTAVFAASLFELMGYEVSPRFCEDRADIIQAVILRDSGKLLRFCEGIQRGSPVDSMVRPEPWDMPGYGFPPTPPCESPMPLKCREASPTRRVNWA
jgi:cystathionine beta-lyase family protein involved in aluminum resistance